MRKIEKIIGKGKALIGVIGKCFSRASITNEANFMNHEYNMDIGTLYKGSIKESNEILRFKERFKMGYLAKTVDTQGKYVEVI